MENITLNKISDICGGTFFGSKEQGMTPVENVVIDSRKLEQNDLFVALKGEHADGHTFIPMAFDKGAFVLSEKRLSDPTGAYVLVENCMKALNDLASYYRNSFPVKVVGITGSVGKTSTKEMIASVLGQKYRTLKTEGNFNNELGLPLTIFRLNHTYEVAVLEMGISEFGEMERLSRMATPDVAVLTNIGLCHLESLKSRDGILKAKTEMFQHIKSGAAIVLNGDDDKLATVTPPKGSEIQFFGIEEQIAGNPLKKQVYATNIEKKGLKGIELSIHTQKGAFEVLIPIPGEHNVYNALAATTVGLSFGLSLEEIKEGIATVKTISGRTNLMEVSKKTLIDDGYNANPVSMKSAFDVLEMAEGRTIAVLGDMKDLGENEKELHYETGKYLSQKKIDVLFCTGELMKELVKGLHDSNASIEIHYFDLQEDMEKELFPYLKEQDSILIKSSHYFMDFIGLRERLKAM